jgi:hypothetical protein
MTFPRRRLEPLTQRVRARIGKRIILDTTHAQLRSGLDGMSRSAGSVGGRLTEVLDHVAVQNAGTAMCQAGI